MTDAMMVTEQQGMSRTALLSAAALKVEMEQRSLLGQYVKQMMVDGTDFGKIPGTEKPTLLKPGAEKLVSLFHCAPEFLLVAEQCETDFERGFFKYTFRCVIRGPGGAVVAEGYGSANSREQRYRWRTANRKCPACGKEAIIQGKAEYGGGWLCFKKKGGCGEKFATGDKAIEGQAQGRVENEDIADLDNTILKMAKKRALVDGAIALARCSDMFTQDVEDFHGQESRQPPAEEPPPPSDDGWAPPPSNDGGFSPPPKEEPKKKGKPPAALLTIEEAEKKDRSKEFVGFKQWKSRKIAELGDGELGEAWDAGQVLEKELSDPGHRDHWSLNAVKNRVLLLSLEYELREKRAAAAMRGEASP